MSQDGDRRSWAAVGRAVATEWRLWPAALSAGRSLVPPGWWRRWPFLPVPSRRWVRFRMVTAYGGDGTGPPSPTDVITWIRWRASLPR